MKKAKIIFLLLLSALYGHAQSPKEVFLSSEITWFGLDFSHAKLLGSFTAFDDKGSKTGDQIRDLYFPGWNNLIVKESEKYNFARAYQKKSVSNDLTLVTKRNSDVNANEIYSTKPEDKNHLTKDDVAKIVQHYKSDKTGTGLLYIIDNFDKAGNEGTMYVTFFDIASGTVLITERFSGKPGGFGIKNYWAGAIRNVIESSEKDYKKWEKQYK